jgi:23S rRNA pseudouridine2605 synthase
MTRLNKHIARILGVSRREADDLITEGKVTIDGKVATLGEQTDENSSITVDGTEIDKSSAAQYIALNKPVNYVCSRKQQGDSPTIYDLLPDDLKPLKTVGRLDRDSSGIILLTNDGDFAHTMTHPSFSKIKIYEVQLNKPLQPLHQQMISDHGVDLDDGNSKFMIEKLSDTNVSEHLQPEGDQTSGPRSNAARSNSENVVFDGDKSYQITMKEGRNRQIRRTFESLGYTVTKLHRIQFGNFQLGDLGSGQLQKVEIN